MVKNNDLFNIPEYKALILGILCILVYYIPYLVYWDSMYIHIHDNLDSTVSYFKILKDTGNLFNLNGEFSILGGIDRSSFPSQIIYLLLNKYSSIFTAYFLNDLLGRLVGFVGMYLLLSRYVIKEDQYKNIISLIVSVCFSVAGYFPVYGSFSIMGQPLLFYAFLNLKNEKHLIGSFLTIVLVIFNSSFVLVGFFEGIFLFIYYLYLIFKEKRKYIYFFFGFILLTIFYIVQDLPVFLHFLTSQLPSHRSEFQLYDVSISDIIYESVRLLYRPHYHTVALPSFLILLLTIFLWFKFKKIDNNTKLVGLLIVFTIIFCMIYGIIVLKFHEFKFMKMFQFNRFYFLMPVMWMVLFALNLKYVIKLNRGKLLFIFFSIFFLGSVIYFNKEYRITMYRIVADVRNKPFSIEEPTFKQFYDEQLFNDIETYLGNKKQYKVICLGFHPAIALYNGFQTLDGYFVNYPLEYKHKFREIIAEELNKSDDNRKYFDNWGSRCYLLSHEFDDFLHGKDKNTKVLDLSINTLALKNIGGEYIFSSVEIVNYEPLGLSFVKEFSSPKSFWNIKVYKVK